MKRQEFVCKDFLFQCIQRCRDPCLHCQALRRGTSAAPNWAEVSSPVSTLAPIWLLQLRLEWRLSQSKLQPSRKPKLSDYSLLDFLFQTIRYGHLLSTMNLPLRWCCVSSCLKILSKVWHEIVCTLNLLQYGWDAVAVLGGHRTKSGRRRWFQILSAAIPISWAGRNSGELVSLNWRGVGLTIFEKIYIDDIVPYMVSSDFLHKMRASKYRRTNVLEY